MMTKPVSNSDVEGVVSSVRRLVDDNKRPPMDTAGARQDRFILSPEWRVGHVGVLRLQPEDAVKVTQDRGVTEKPPLADKSAAGDEAHGHAHETSTINARSNEEIDSAVVVKDPGDLTVDASLQAKGTVSLGDEEGKASRMEVLAAKITALETAIARTCDQWEPDGDSRDDYSGTQSEAMAWQDSVELDATGVPIGVSADVDAEEETGDDGAVPGGEQVLDEGALRDLVAEIVRSELQGGLGERISRNVRKLVRREIHRALAAKELE